MSEEDDLEGDEPKSLEEEPRQRCHGILVCSTETPSRRLRLMAAEEYKREYFREKRIREERAWEMINIYKENLDKQLMTKEEMDEMFAIIRAGEYHTHPGHHDWDGIRKCGFWMVTYRFRAQEVYEDIAFRCWVGLETPCKDPQCQWCVVQPLHTKYKLNTLDSIIAELSTTKPQNDHLCHG